MRILILTPYYLPDSGPSAPLFSMLSEALVARGHQVTVISAFPHYPSGRVKPEYSNQSTMKSIENGVNIIRVPVPSVDRTKFLPRLTQFAAYQIRACMAGWSEAFDVLLVSNPFLMVGIAYLVLGILRHKPSIYSIHDVYPDVGEKLGIFRNRFVSWTIEKGEVFFLKRAKAVRILSDSFVPAMLRLGVPEEKLRLIYDWVDTQLIEPKPKENPFSEEFNLADCFVVLYAGNIGLSQGLEHVLDAAQNLEKYPDIRFVFVGDGSGRERLEKEAAQRGLDNVNFIPFQPRSRLPDVLASGDVSLVILQKGLGSGSLPSKSFSILSSGRPILASVDPDSDTARLVERSQGGICIPPEDPQRLAQAILDLRADGAMRERLGFHGRKYAVQYHSPQSAAMRFEEIFAEIM